MHTVRLNDNRPADPKAFVLQVHRAAGDTWHSFASMEDAAAYALELLQVIVDSKTYPVAIWHADRKLWKPYGRHGKLHVASTRDALASLSRGLGGR